MQPESTERAREREELYFELIKDLASRLVIFKPLSSFLGLRMNTGPCAQAMGYDHSMTASNITVVEYREGLPSVARNIDESHLKSELASKAVHRVFLVENLSPATLLLLGGHLDVDPQFFLDYLDAIPAEYDLTKGATIRRLRDEIIPTPWYRLESVDAHVPVPRHRQSMGDHVLFRFVRPREFHGGKSDPRGLANPIYADLTKMNIERSAGLHIPLARDGCRFPHLALVRQCAAAWLRRSSTDPEGAWQAIVLLDPPFRIQSTEYGTLKDSLYRPIARHFVPTMRPNGSAHPVPTTTRGLDVMTHYLTCHLLGHGAGVPHANDILRAMVLMTASEWTTVATYMERDLNTIEWRLERDSLPIEALAEMQQRLFCHRRRVRKYKHLIGTQVTFLQDEALPGHFRRAASNPGDGVLVGADQHQINGPLVQALHLMEQNQTRLAESIQLIGSLISVRQGTLSIGQNRTLGFLALIATWALPFNVLAAVLGMQTEFGYGQSRWRDFVVLTCCMAAALSVIYLVYLWFTKLFRSGRLKKRFE